MKKTKAQAGFTLIEVILAMAILGLVLTLAYSFLNNTQLLYTKAQSRVDAQSQLRIGMNQLKRELSVATHVEICNSETETKDAGYDYFYVNDQNTLVLQTGNDISTATSPPGCLPLPGQAITFSPSPSANNILVVDMTSADGFELKSEILLQNNSGGIITPVDNKGDMIAFIRIN